MQEIIGAQNYKVELLLFPIMKKKTFLKSKPQQILFCPILCSSVLPRLYKSSVNTFHRLLNKGRRLGARFSTQKMTWHCCCHNVTTFLSDYLSCFLHSLPDRGCLKVGQKELNILLLLPPSHSIGFGEPSLLLMWANFTLGSKQRATVLQSKNSLCKTTWN